MRYNINNGCLSPKVYLQTPNHTTMKNPWQFDAAMVAQQFATNVSTGLSSEEASRRLVRYGRNTLREKRGPHPLIIFAGQFQDFIVWVLLAAALISGLLKELVDALAILGIVILNALLGFIQEYRAERSLSALKKLSSPTARVLRDSKEKVIPAADLVPGDVIELAAGDHIPADGRLVWVTPNFAVQEASLTGESLPVNKTTVVLPEENIALGERMNMVYLGTCVVAGRGRAIITTTGMETELGRIAGMIQEIKRETTPLQKRLERFGKWLVYLCLILVALIFLLGILRGKQSTLDLFLAAVSLAVAAIPEGLPAVVTIALALGVQRMVKRHSLIRKLPSVETLGCTTVVCTDKTGTLTRNEMVVKYLYAQDITFEVTGAGYRPKGELLSFGKSVNPDDYPALKRSLVCGVLCNSAQLTEENGVWQVIGDPTEGALLVCAGKVGIWKEEIEKEFPFFQEIPFDSERKRMTVIRRIKGSSFGFDFPGKEERLAAFVKGAPDLLLNDCQMIDDGTSVRQLGKEERRKIEQLNLWFTNQAMRVLATAYRVLKVVPEQIGETAAIEKDLTFAGLIAMSDPPREEAKEAIRRCQQAGIKTVMITGDHKGTAVAIAKSLGFFEEDSLALTGAELDALDEMEFARIVGKVAVYARVSPEHKLRIVSGLKKKGEVVAMTGDGVNDAPAVKEADIGIAMGITGTDVTKEVSDMVITDDNFASIVAAVEEGRGIYDNIKKFIHYLLSCNAGEVLVMFVASLVGLPTPLLPVQILWVNLVTDGFPALALGVDPLNYNVMERPPRHPEERVVSRREALLILSQGLLIAFCSLTAFAFVLFVEKGSLSRARTLAFMVLACSQLFHSFNCRSREEPILKTGIMANPKLVAAVAFSLLLQFSVIYLPGLKGIFKSQPLSGSDMGTALILSFLPLWVVELVKLSHKRKG